MAQAVLSSILDQLDLLQAQELHQLELVVRARLTAQEKLQNRAAFHQALVSSGLVKQLRTQGETVTAEYPGIVVEGRPVSDTIVEERR